MEAIRTKSLMYLLVTLLSIVLLLTACASIYTPVDLKANTTLVWPGQPAKPRIAYVASFKHPENLGIKKGFFTRLGELFTGEEERKMVRPMAITKTTDNVLFIADPGVKGVHRYDLSKKRFAIIRRKDEMILPSPVGLASDKNDNVYVVDSELARLFIIKKNENEAIEVFLDEPLMQPTAIAIDSTTGALYITDAAAHDIKCFSKEGKLKFTIGKRGKAEGEFNFPTMIWRDASGQLYVTDALNFRIQVFNREGSFVRFFGKQGDGSGNMSRPKGVATDRSGHVYVVDGLFHAVQLFDENGGFLLNIGGQGHGHGEFWLPSGIFIGENDTIYIADSHNQRVQVFRYIGGQF